MKPKRAEQDELNVIPIAISPKRLKVVCLVEWLLIVGLSYGCLTLLSKALIGFN